MEDTDKSKVLLPDDLQECINILRESLSSYIQLIDLLIGVLDEQPSCVKTRKEIINPDKKVTTALVPMLLGVGSSSNTLVKLSESVGMHTRDCFGITRSIVEGSINICYIISEGIEIAEQAIKHARQKSIRDMERKSSIGGSEIKLIFSGIQQIKELNNVDDDLEQFTSKKSGREKGWTDLSVDSRITIVGNKLDKSIMDSLHWARFIIYRHSSEILHGTLFGAHFLWGQTLPNRPKSLNEMAINIGQNHMSILMATNLSLLSLVNAFHKKYGYEFVSTRSRELFQRIRDIPYFMDGKE